MKEPEEVDIPKLDERSRNCFYLNGDLHQILHIDRGNDTVKTFNFGQGKIKIYPWSMVLKNKQNAFSLYDTGKLLGRSRNSIHRYIKNEEVIKLPQYIYSRKTGYRSRYMLSEDEVMEIRDYLSNVHIGRPRKDGRVTNRVPSKKQLRTMMRTRRVLYVREDDGTFVPVWESNEW